MFGGDEVTAQKLQRCVMCDEETGRCQEDALFSDDTGPLCDSCFNSLEDDKDLTAGNDK